LIYKSPYDRFRRVSELKRLTLMVLARRKDTAEARPAGTCLRPGRLGVSA